MSHYLRRKFLNAVQPISEFIGKVELPVDHKLDPRIDDYYLENFRKYARVGQVVLSRQSWCLTNLVIPGFFKHVSMVSFDETIVEAVGTGVRKVPFEKFFRHEDYVVLLHPFGVDAVEMILAAEWWEKQIGKPYDFLLDQNDITAFFCAEGPLLAYLEVTNGKFDFEMREKLGVETATAQDYANAIKKWKTTWESRRDLRLESIDI